MIISSSVTKKISLTIGYHRVQLQIIASMWCLTKITTKHIIDHWFIGILPYKIPPLILFVSKDLEH